MEIPNDIILKEFLFLFNKEYLERFSGLIKAISKTLIPKYQTGISFADYCVGPLEKCSQRAIIPAVRAVMAKIGEQIEKENSTIIIFSELDIPSCGAPSDVHRISLNDVCARILSNYQWLSTSQEKGWGVFLDMGYTLFKTQ